MISPTFLPELITSQISLPRGDQRFDCIFLELYRQVFFESSTNGLILKNEIYRQLPGMVPGRYNISYEGNEYLLLISQEPVHNSLHLRIYSHRAGLELSVEQCGVDALPNIWREHLLSLSRNSLKLTPKQIEQVAIRHQLAPLWNSTSHQQMLSKVLEECQKIRLCARRYRKGIFEKMTDYALLLTAKYTLIRMHLLKFVAILPSLDFDYRGTHVKKLLLEALRRFYTDSQILSSQKNEHSNLPWYLLLIVNFLQTVLKYVPALPLSMMTRFVIRQFAARFMVSEKAVSIANVTQYLAQTNRSATFDALGELVVSEKEASVYFKRVCWVIDELSKIYPSGKKNAAGIYLAHLSLKVTALTSHLSTWDFELTAKELAPKLFAILKRARDAQVFVHIDAEHYAKRDLVWFCYARALTLNGGELTSYQQTGIVVQAYLRDAISHLNQIIHFCQEQKRHLVLRLVKGAYWDAEVIEAQNHGHTPPQFLNKAETDLHFKMMVELILKNGQWVSLCVASHNLMDHAFAVTLRKECYPDAPVIEHQCLHQTAESLSEGLAQMGYPTRSYVPLGDLLVGMGYLVRRIMENSSQVGVLAQERLNLNQKMKESENFTRPFWVHAKSVVAWDKNIEHLTPQFFNQRPLLSYLGDERSAFWRELELMEKRHFVIGKGDTTSAISIVSKTESKKVLGTVNYSSESEVNAAVESASLHLQSKDELLNWALKTPAERCLVIIKCAELLKLERLPLAALIVLESGKTPDEALGDVDEAIDFLQFYPREYLQMQGKFTPKGVIAVIAPWNFPLAILAGMGVAPLICGNPVILKPAEQTPLIAHLFAELMYRGGVPKAFFQLVYGDAFCGKMLVHHPKVVHVQFTGSKEVGLYLMQHKSCQLVNYVNISTKQVIQSLATVGAELGGKNAIIVTASAELDEVVAGILKSAFSHAGQKCSAASRIIVHQGVFKRLMERLVAAASDLKVSLPTDPLVQINPLIDSQSYERIQSLLPQMLDEAQQFGGTVHLNRFAHTLGKSHFLMGPVLIELPPERFFQSDSFSMRELFAPIVHLTTYQELDEAILLFNATAYALTGGIFAQSQDECTYLSQKLRCGNLYINRPIVGARVGVEPFGGFQLSGTGPKAGGKDYLRLFTFESLNLTPHELIVPEISHVQETSSPDFSFKGSVPLPLVSRCVRLQRGLGRILTQFDELFPNTKGQNAVLTDFKKWVSLDLVNYLDNFHSNLKIEGQQSYDSYKFSKEHGLFFVESQSPEIHSLLYFFSSLALGASVNVITIHPRVYDLMERVLQLLQGNAPELSRAKVLFLQQPDFTTCQLPHLDYTKVEFLIGQRYSSHFHQLYEHLLKRGTLNGSKHLILSYLPTHAPHPMDFAGHFKAFIYPRSFAVNTMRHGAPLEIFEFTT